MVTIYLNVSKNANKIDDWQKNRMNSNMTVIILKTWQEGMEKVSLSKLQMDLLNLPLSIAKKNVDSLLEGHEVVIEFDDLQVAIEFVNEATKLGVIALIQ